MVDLSLIELILKRNNYEIQFSGDQDFKIIRHAKGSSILNIYYTSAIISIVIGGVVLFLGSIWGFVFMSPAIPLLVKVSDWKKRDELNRKTTVQVNADFLEIEKPGVIFQCPKNTVKELGVEVERDEQVYAGSLFLESEEDGQIVLLEFFGEEHNYVKDDLVKIRDFILQKMK